MDDYYNALCEAMKMLSEHPDTIFMGQGVTGGTTMSGTFKDVPDSRKLEMPVAEDMQMGMALGMSLKGRIPICVFPRHNFMYCAMNQLVNHLDRLPLYSDYRPKVIIRVATPSKDPFNPGPQHDDEAFGLWKNTLRTIPVVSLTSSGVVRSLYEWAMEIDGSVMLIERTELYRNVAA